MGEELSADCGAMASGACRKLTSLWREEERGCPWQPLPNAIYRRRQERAPPPLPARQDCARQLWLLPERGCSGHRSAGVKRVL